MKNTTRYAINRTHTIILALPKELWWHMGEGNGYRSGANPPENLRTYETAGEARNEIERIETPGCESYKGHRIVEIN